MAASQDLTTDEDSGLSILLSGTDADGDVLSYEVVTDPANGSLSGTAPVLTYSPNENYNGSDSFTFRVTDGTLSDTASVSITVNAVNDAPLAFDLLTPEDNETIFIGDDDDLLDTLSFSWSEAVDVDGDIVHYSIFRTDNFIDDSLFVGEEAHWTIPVQDIYELMEQNQVSNYMLTWYVKAHDGEFDVQSSQIFTFNIDATELLSIEVLSMVPESFNLYQNFPNPFNPSTQIAYDIPERGEVQVLIYDLSGKLVTSINEGIQEPGQYKINWNATDRFGKKLSGGVYIYQIKTEKFVKSRKMLLLK